MKILIQKISLFVACIVTAYYANAQVIEVSASVSGYSQKVDNEKSFDATKIGIFTNINLKEYMPVTVSIKNTSATDNLVLTQQGGKYIIVSGTGAADFSIDESSLTGTIAPGATQTFTVTLSAEATNGDNKVVSFSVQNNSLSNSTAGVYSGNIKYNLSGIVTAITKASDIGLSLYPNPSKDGQMHVSATNVNIDRIVVSNVSGQTEEFTTKEFKTSFKGLLLVRLYTDKGVVLEKIVIQE